MSKENMLTREKVGTLEHQEKEFELDPLSRENVRESQEKG